MSTTSNPSPEEPSGRSILDHLEAVDTFTITADWLVDVISDERVLKEVTGPFIADVPECELRLQLVTHLHVSWVTSPVMETWDAACFAFLSDTSTCAPAVRAAAVVWARERGFTGASQRAAPRRLS